ncbi:amidohydrolase [Sporothrix brasiliensis 5110]|uniref:Peptidase M20 domain-containing protein 2 n=1 Tax=Sporothrix brasiliensis 5110 TaxID=1398154 RepID=A0A0C2IF43_9PEZI|nr:amidohydrolase [Sporothrix brasiliensis 5110]KIH87836.1 amidohydrolase [Sporothrix brasiliensis 5110]
MGLSANDSAAGIEAQMSVLSEMNSFIHSNPEVSSKEVKAHDHFVEVLKRLDVKVTPHAYDVYTSFKAEYGEGGRLVVFNAEYDALPGVGHACGHNLIATASFAGFLGAVAALKKAGPGTKGRVTLMGTPAEEAGGGKIKLIKGGAYKDVAACLMVHPAPLSSLQAAAADALDGNDASGVSGVAKIRLLACIKYAVSFKGREAHAAMSPWAGVNALDAVCLAYNGISMLRQQIHPNERIHGVFREAGDQANVTPAHTSVVYHMRSDTLAHAETLWQRVKNCFDGAATATGCTVDYEPIDTYAEQRSSPGLCQAYVDAMPKGTVLYTTPTDFMTASTDMGNVCYECPGFQGAFGIDAPPGAGNHTGDFTGAAGTDDAFQRAVACGRGLAATALKVLSDDKFAASIKSAWQDDMKAAKKEHQG